MTRWNGSLIGVQKNTSLIDSTGVWNLRRQTLAKQNGVWPLDNSGIPQPNWSLDFSSGSPWANGTDYTFVSTASTSRTFVTSSGYIAPCVANLVQRSGEFENAYWNDGSNTTCAGVASPTAPDNSTDAAELKETAASGIHYRGRNLVSVTAGTVTFSAYVKKQSRQYIGLYFISTNTYNVIFDLDNNAAFSADRSVGTPNGSYGSQDVGNGWYRIWITLTTGGSGSVNTYPGVFLSDRAGFTSTLVSNMPSYTGSTSESVYVWGLQCVEGSAPLPYSATTTSSNGIPRLTHNSSGSRLGLLVEGQRTNLFTYSEAPVTGSYGTFGATWTENDATSPSNTTTAAKLTEAGSASDPHYGRSGTIGITNGASYSWTVYAKAGTSTVLQLSCTASGVSTNDWANFDLSNGVVGSVGTNVTGDDATITNVGNGWYRCKLTFSATATSSPQFIYAHTNNSTTAGRQPTYAPSSRTLFLWGWQLEENATASSYIPTTTASVTRNEDKVHITKSKITNWSSPGAVCVHFYKPLQAGTLVSTDDAVTEQLGIQASSTTAARAFWSSGQTDTGIIGAEGVVHKAIHYWNGTTSKFCINGSDIRVGTNNVTNFNNTNFITLGAEATDSSGSPGTFSNYANCIIRKVEFYAGELSDEALQQITDNNTMYPVQYLVIAGGAGGGTFVSGSNIGGGGGGAGGYLTGTATYLIRGTNYQVTVGAGGGRNTNGNDSSFNSLVAIGGGKGGYGTSGSSGGSGGGGNNGGLGGTGTTGQGNDGGGSVGGWPYAGGGGGGAGSAGAAGTAAGAGAAGNGASSSITGTAITRAGGGGAGAHNSSTVGGSGGGGAGAGWLGIAGNGTANTGSGGGGATHESINGGTGGSGVVILRILTGNYTGTTTGTPAVSEVGSDTVLVFNSSGSYTA